MFWRESVAQEIKVNKVIAPTEDRVLLLWNDNEKKTESGIIIAGNSSQRHDCRVLKIVESANKFRQYIGDYAIVNSHSGIEIEHEGTKYVIVNNSEVHGIIEG